jgi:hypothetical protein
MHGQIVAARPIRSTPLTLAMIHAKWATVRAAGETVGTTLHHACYYVLDFFFGDPWLRDYVLVGCRRPGFLSMRPVIQSDGMGIDKDHTLRVVQLAEVLFNLQGIPGFEHCLDRMFGGQIESAMAELEFGMFLHRQGVSFNYIKPSGVKKQDYDVDVPYEGGTVACGDIKCKLEGSDYTEATLLNSLKKVRHQLPADRPGIAFVKVPQDWLDASTGNLGASGSVAETLKKFFSTTKRMVLVVFYAKLTFELPRGTAVRYVALERENSSSRYAGERSWRLFDDIRDRPNWVDFTQLLDGHHW